MPSLKDRIKDILLRDKLISSDDLQKVLQEQKKAGGELSRILMKNKMIGEDILAQILSESMGIPQIRLSRFKVDVNVLPVIPQEMAEKYQMMPVSLLGDVLTVCMADPLNILAIDNLKAVTGFTIIPIVGSAKDILASIKSHYEAVVETEDDTDAADKFNAIMQDIQETDGIELIKDSSASQENIVEEIADQAPIIKLTDTIIQQAAIAQASDVFIEPLEKTMRIRYRIDGVIREIDKMAKFLHNPIISRIKVISNLDISEHRLPQDGRFKTLIGDSAVDYRVSVLPTVFGEKIVLRVLDQRGTVLDVDKLGFEENSLRRLKECSVRPHGMILTCGPTGSGKTTTLYSILKYIDSPEKNIVTVEDPVEYQLKSANQVNVKPAVGLTFPAALRSILRQDPDVILIGEIRDKQTLDIAVKAALTGHLVLSSLHTTTAAGSVIRMMNMGIEPFLICSSVLAIVAQRLLRRICPKCKEPYVLSDDIARKVGVPQVTKEKNVTLFRGKGCKHCFNTGYKGRVGITEVLVLSPTIKELILSRAGEINIKKGARKEGMRTMREDGLKKALEGLTSLEEVLRITAPDQEL